MKKTRNRAATSASERNDRLETLAFRLFGFLLGMIATHVLIHTM